MMMIPLRARAHLDSTFFPLHFRYTLGYTSKLLNRTFY